MNREEAMAFQHGRLLTANMIALLDLKRILERIEEGYYENCQTLLYDQIERVKEKLESPFTN